MSPDQQISAATKKPEFDFRTCGQCGGYGVRDSGRNCVTCGGTGSGGLRSTNGMIGSGEIIIETATGRIVPPAEFRRIMMERHRSGGRPA